MSIIIFEFSFIICLLSINIFNTHFNLFPLKIKLILTHEKIVDRVKRSGESVGAPVAIPTCIQNPPVDP